MAKAYHLSQIVKFLREKHIVMSPQNEWLLGCYEYYLSENPSVANNLPALMNFVFEQWLLADLRDVAEAYLPQNINEAEKLILSGIYPLQVDIMINVAESVYSQVQKIKRLTSENLEVTEIDEKKAWEPKAKRMLKLMCTDGVRQVFGMEYELIPFLCEPFIPGCKILVTGPVECRKGIIFLTPRNVTLLGGEVDSLITENSQLNYLARKLNEINPLGEEVAGTIQAVTDQSNIPSASNRTGESNSISTTETRPSTQETIAFTQFNDDAMDEDDDIFLSDQLEQVENLINVRQMNPPSNPRHDNNSRPADGSGDNGLPLTKRPRQQSPVARTALSGTSNSESSLNSFSSVDEQIVPSHRLPTLDLSNQPENVIPKSSSSLNSNLCSDSTVRTLRRLHECSALRLDITYKCRASVTKLRSKPRIKNDNWLMSVDISDEEASLEVGFHGSFLDGIFGYTALEVFSQKERIKSNESVKEKIDQVMKEGAAKILSLKGEFFIKSVPNSDLPTVVRVRENAT